MCPHALCRRAAPTSAVAKLLLRALQRVHFAGAAASKLAGVLGASGGGPWPPGLVSSAAGSCADRISRSHKVRRAARSGLLARIGVRVSRGHRIVDSCAPASARHRARRSELCFLMRGQLLLGPWPAMAHLRATLSWPLRAQLAGAPHLEPQQREQHQQQHQLSHGSSSGGRACRGAHEEAHLRCPLLPLAAPGEVAPTHVCAPLLWPCAWGGLQVNGAVAPTQFKVVFVLGGPGSGKGTQVRQRLSWLAAQWQVAGGSRASAPRPGVLACAVRQAAGGVPGHCAPERRRLAARARQERHARRQHGGRHDQERPDRACRGERAWRWWQWWCRRLHAAGAAHHCVRGCGGRAACRSRLGCSKRPWSRRASTPSSSTGSRATWTTGRPSCAWCGPGVVGSLGRGANGGSGGCCSARASAADEACGRPSFPTRGVHACVGGVRLRAGALLRLPRGGAGAAPAGPQPGRAWMRAEQGLHQGGAPWGTPARVRPGSRLLTLGSRARVRPRAGASGRQH